MFARHKYKAQPQVIDGVRLASKAEACRYLELKDMMHYQIIRGLCVHPRYVLFAHDPDGRPHKVGVYEADFAYILEGRRVIEDVKGVRTPMFKWKKKHFEIQFREQIVEVRCSNGKCRQVDTSKRRPRRKTTR